LYSPRRPYHWIAHPHDPVKLRRLERSEGVRCVRWAEEGRDRFDGTVASTSHAWAECVAECLARENYLELERLLHQMEAATNIAELDMQAAEELSRRTPGAAECRPSAASVLRMSEYELPTAN
jgi:hypothetical protein